jgi:hypothetical protein
MRDSLHSFAVELGVEVAVCLLQDEVRQLCGSRSERVLKRTAYRHGSQPGYVVLAGQKVGIVKPRVRGTSGEEVGLATYAALQAETAMPASALAKLVRIDAVDFAGAAMVCALGIADDGTKHVLGVRQGDTENAEVVQSLLAGVRDRGVPTDRSLLFVLDGSKALRAGVKRVWGANAVIQRCQIHKRRNVKAHLAKQHHAELDRRLNEAYYGQDYQQSLKQLRATVTWLDKLNPDAANSLREGLDETLTVIRLDLTGDLRRLLSNTNAIESTFSRVRDVTRRDHCCAAVPGTGKTAACVAAGASPACSAPKPASAK